MLRDCYIEVTYQLLRRLPTYLRGFKSRSQFIDIPRVYH